MPKAFVVQGLTTGDEAKGSITESLVRKHDIKLVVRSSGASQCAHNVTLENGQHHTFSTWGSGTLAGASTLLTKDVLIDPIRLYNEGHVLASKGVHEPFPRMMIDSAALVITPYHRALNRLKELNRTSRHGSCGIGVGETARYALEYPDRALRIGDLESIKLTQEKLWVIREDLRLIANKLVKPGEWTLDGDPFVNPDSMDALLWRYHTFTKSGLRICDTNDILRAIRGQDTVWEGAQGVLLDEDVGFHPYTTWSRTRLINSAETLQAAGITDITNIGVLRTYGHRHGAGPFPSEDETVGDIIQEPHNVTNEWQREFRLGWFDMVLAKYAVQKAGFGCKAKIHQLALTHVDALDKRKTWPIVTNYGLDIHWDIPKDDFHKRERLTGALMGVRPEDRKCGMVNNKLVPSYIESELGLPVTITSNGPTFADKQFA